MVVRKKKFPSVLNHSSQICACDYSLLPCTVSMCFPICVHVFETSFSDTLQVLALKPFYRWAVCAEKSCRLCDWLVCYGCGALQVVPNLFLSLPPLLLCIYTQLWPKMCEKLWSAPPPGLPGLWVRVTHLLSMRRCCVKPGALRLVMCPLLY